MSGFTLTRGAFATEYLESLRLQIRKCPWFTVNNLNRDFVGTRGFSVVFRREQRARLVSEFPFYGPYLDVVLRDDCNAFYINPLELEAGSRVDPHIDRSLRAYLEDITTPLQVSVLYVDVPPAMQGGRLVLTRGKKHLGRVTPEPGLLVAFQGDLLHGVERVETPGKRLSLVCEQYLLDEKELAAVPDYQLESRAKRY
ncbi:MAG: 2OG-Fe(II) oxygenase [Planctomycetes bacterium]|nr:2OG-Fe(II) oxygenase [Planctomycetota bacterium]MCC7397668.1 2OG-Fe(II) oxygenase [Planctomycetota bacterium]